METRPILANTDNKYLKVRHGGGEGEEEYLESCLLVFIPRLEDQMALT